MAVRALRADWRSLLIVPEHDPALADLMGRHVWDGRGFTTGQGQVMDIGFTEFSLDKFLEILTGIITSDQECFMTQILP
nr:hypothetical protein [Gluconobacter frateurii]